MSRTERFEVVVVGGGPAGATAATELARRGRRVLLLERGGRIKPCGGAIPPRLVEEFAIPDALLVSRIRAARMTAPSGRQVDMPIEGGYVGMVDREAFDPWLRQRAAAAGAVLRTGTFEALVPEADGSVTLTYREPGESGAARLARVRARGVVGADGARSILARRHVPGGDATPFVAAYHEIIRSPGDTGAAFAPERCEVHYQGRLSPDFYGWIFPHGETTSVGVGTARRGFSLRAAVHALRETTGLAGCDTLRREGAPIPLRPLPRWDDARNLVLAGDAAGVVAPASGEGIYYAMTGGRMAAEAVDALCRTGDARALATARKSFLRAHGKVFWVLGLMQRFWYANDRRRERFVSMCRDPDVQQLTWDAYMNKRLVRARPAAHVRVLCKDLGHLLGVVRP